jgi:hypothetical protein
MKSIGLFTGKIYETHEQAQSSKECCQQIHYELSQEEILKLKLKCLSCPGDPECIKGQS